MLSSKETNSEQFDVLKTNNWQNSLYLHDQAFYYCYSTIYKNTNYEVLCPITINGLPETRSLSRELHFFKQNSKLCSN